MVFIPPARIGHGSRWVQNHRNDAGLHIANVSGVYYFLLGERSSSLLPPMSSYFYQLLTILLAGFVQAMYALDAADGSADQLSSVSSSVIAPG